MVDIFLPQYDIIKDLGITFQSNLQLFSTRIDQISVKAIKTLGFLLRCTKLFVRFSFLRFFYVSWYALFWNTGPLHGILLQNLIYKRVQIKWSRFFAYKWKSTNIIVNTSVQSLQFNLKLDSLLAPSQFIRFIFLV